VEGLETAAEEEEEEDEDLRIDCILDCSRDTNFPPNSINAVTLSPSPRTFQACQLSY